MKLKEIKLSETELLNEAAELVSKYSWGYEYPVKPIDEILSSGYRIGAFITNQFVGFGTVGRAFSPDNLDNGELWIAHAVVIPEFRQQGIFRKIYKAQLAYARSQSGCILSCTDNPIVVKFFLENGWRELRKTIDESSKASTVFEYRR